ncbi:MAG: SMC-Scp complex subunit ScpB, partial [Phycisphaerae bacterium]
RFRDPRLVDPVGFSDRLLAMEGILATLEDAMNGGEHTPSEGEVAPPVNEAEDRAEDELTAPACESVADDPADAEGDTDTHDETESAAEALDGDAADPVTSPGSGDDGVEEIVPERVVEAVLFSADSPLPAAKIASVLGVGTGRDVRQHIESLNRQYAEHGQAFRIEQIAAGYQMMTLPAYNTWLRKLLRARQEARLTPAAMETLAIVAYKQPCTRAEVEAVRGVAVGEVMNRLRDMNLVKIVGRAEDLGRPMLYGTTKRFLEVFGLPSLNDLPKVEALAGGDASPKDKSPDKTPIELKQDADEHADSVPPAVDTEIAESPVDEAP